MKRSAFTMIELIFVIVIIGILASVAIPKIQTTMNDANIVKELSNLKTAKTDIIAAVQSTGTNANLPTNDLECFEIAVSNTMLLTVTDSLSTAIYCDKARLDAIDSNLNEDIQL